LYLVTEPAGPYDPFARGRHPAGVRTIQAPDAARGRLFPCEIWYPAQASFAGRDLAPDAQDRFTVPMRAGPRSQAAVRDAAALPGTYPLIVYSHPGGFHRRAATYLCTHLASHGYVVAALDHSEVVAPELARKDGETPARQAARTEAWISSRVPDIRFLLDRLLTGEPWDPAITLDPARIGIAGHSFGGWTALAAVAADPRLRAVVALAPAGSSRPAPGIVRVELTFGWGRDAGRDVPALYLAAENDTPIPLDGLYELYERTPEPKQLLILRRADHSHFMDHVEEEHENFRALPLAGELAWIPKAMRPIAELCSGEQSHLFARGLTLAHMDAALRSREDARCFLLGDLAAALARRGVDAIEHRPRLKARPAAPPVI
jgi:dienelactone hydrolase